MNEYPRQNGPPEKVFSLAPILQINILETLGIIIFRNHKTIMNYAGMNSITVCPGSSDPFYIVINLDVQTGSDQILIARSGSDNI